MILIRELADPTNVPNIFTAMDNPESVICIRTANCSWPIITQSSNSTKKVVNAIYGMERSIAKCLPNYWDYIEHNQGFEKSCSFPLYVHNIEYQFYRIVISGGDLITSSKHELQNFCLFNSNKIF